jgi:hypothetical protein
LITLWTCVLEVVASSLHRDIGFLASFRGSSVYN